MIFSFGKNASTSVFKTANHLKDVIEKKVIYVSFLRVKNKILSKLKEKITVIISFSFELR